MSQLEARVGGGRGRSQDSCHGDRDHMRTHLSPDQARDHLYLPGNPVLRVTMLLTGHLNLDLITTQMMKIVEKIKIPTTQTVLFGMSMAVSEV